ncbi:LysR family transcriptional regulator [Duganella levis]|jgi:DNA-binding transcriptional LysR family regulator|uniref:LysR family transcriptional regulator n=1 Tax=Duganella levis TaxID=2692169 RepID=A0ABW9VXH6_9BURK|nr:LysR family transcriptional regulator [Duganella levis]MYN26347.1 LysR family transcriptional regulator [Duganella levis]
MEFRQLRYFLAVAEHLHFTVAAERLGIAQPPLSQQIIKLEREIGTQLFIRHPRRVELTEAGVIFKERARRVLDDANDALEHVKMAARGESGNLSIGFAGSTVFHPTVARLLRRFREDYPGVKIRTEESNSTALLGKLADAQVDCAMIRLPLDCGDLTVTPLVQEKMIAVLPSGHALGRRRTIDLKQLAADPFILYPRAINPELYDAIISACHVAGFSPRIEMESPQISSGVNMVAAGFGVAIIPESIGQFRSEGVTYQDLRNQGLGTAIALITRPREKSVTVQNFTEMVKQFYRR